MIVMALFALLSSQALAEDIQIEFSVPEEMPMFSEAKMAYSKSTDKPMDCNVSLRAAQGKMEGKDWEKIIAYNPRTWVKDKARAHVEECENVGGKGKKSRVKLNALVANIGKTPAYKAKVVTARRAIKIWDHLTENPIFGWKTDHIQVKPARGELFYFDTRNTDILKNLIDDQGWKPELLSTNILRGYTLFKTEIVEEMQKAFTILNAVPEISGLYLEVESPYYNAEGGDSRQYWTFIMRTKEIAKLVESEFTVEQFLDAIIVKVGSSSEDIAARTIKIK